jgi:multidrug efflux pump subunit AcrB
MSGQDIWQITVIWLMSTVKFVFGAVPLALAFGFSFWKTIAVTCSGGFVGVTLFVNLGEYLVRKARERRERKRAEGKLKPKRAFTRTNKIIVRVKRNFGLPGIALLTPLLLSIPLGSIIAMRYFRHKDKYILFWSFSIASWRFIFPTD